MWNEFKLVKQSTLDRNIKSGKWIAMSKPNEYGSVLIKTAYKTRGCANSAGRMFMIDIEAGESK